MESSLQFHRYVNVNLSTILYSSSSISLLLVAGVVAFKDDRCKVTLSTGTGGVCSL